MKETLRSSIGWDFPQLLISYLGDADLSEAASRLIIQNIITCSNSKEVFLRCTGLVRSSADDSRGGNPDVLERDHTIATSQRQFQKLVQIMCECHSKLSVKKPSRFLADLVDSIIYYYTATKYIHTDARLFDTILQIPEHFLSMSDSAEHDDDMLSKRLLQSYFISFLKCYMEKENFDMISDYWEKQNPHRQLNRTTEKRNGIKLIEHQLERLMKMSDQLDLDLSVLFSEISATIKHGEHQIEDDSEFSDTLNDVHFQKEGLIQLLALKLYLTEQHPVHVVSVSEGVYTNNTVNPSSSFTTAKVADFLQYVINLHQQQQLQGQEMKRRTLDAILYLTCTLLPMITKNPFQFPKILMITLLHVSFFGFLILIFKTFGSISATHDDENIRTIVYDFVDKVLLSQPDDFIAEYIADTMSYCPFPSLQAATVGTAKGYFLQLLKV